MSKVKFTKPPLLEIAFLVEFEELVDFSSVDFWLYWETIKDKFPENFAQYHVFNENEESPLSPLGRGIFISENKSKYLRLQSNIFAYNWRKYFQNKYSNFETIFHEF